MSSLMISMARGIKLHRVSSRMSQDELSRLLGVPENTLSRWEAGVLFPKIRFVSKLAQIFGVSELDLLCPEKEGEEDPEALKVKNVRFWGTLEEKVVKEIKRLRLIRGMSQQDLGKKVGVTLLTISRWERGIEKPDVGFLPKFAEAFGITEEELLNPDPNAEQPKRKRSWNRRTKKEEEIMT